MYLTFNRFILDDGVTDSPEPDGETDLDHRLIGPTTGHRNRRMFRIWSVEVLFLGSSGQFRRGDAFLGVGPHVGHHCRHQAGQAERAGQCCQETAVLSPATRRAAGACGWRQWHSWSSSISFWGRSGEPSGWRGWRSRRCCWWRRRFNVVSTVSDESCWTYFLQELVKFD